MLGWFLRRRRGRDDEAGLGLILVIGTSTVVTALMIVGTTMATRALTGSRLHVSFESAVATAETGIDGVLARTQNAYNHTGSDSYQYPSTSSPCNGTTGINWTNSTAPDGTPAPGSFANETTGLTYERAWAKSWLLTLATDSSCLTHANAGDFVYFKPINHHTIYSMGWSPGLGKAEAKMRYLKSEYLFTPYAPTNAILTQGNVQLDSSTTVQSAPPNDNALASVHANGNVTVDNGNPTVYGPVSQSGSGSATSSNKFYSNTGGNVQVNAVQNVPFVDATTYWYKYSHVGVPGGWYDLCADGSAQAPVGSAHCPGAATSGAILATAAEVQASGFRGWTFSHVTDAAGNSVPTWSATSAVKQNGYSGTYFVNGGDAVDHASNSGADVPNLTILAAAQSMDCFKIGGNINWDQIDIAAYSVRSTFMVADQDILTGSNFHAGSDVNGSIVSGFFIAGDQIGMQTSSTGAYGAVIAGDQCDPADGQSLVDFNEIKNPSIYYDPNAATPFVDIVNTTLWLEFTG